MIEADEVALVVMLIEQNLLPENLQDDKCAIAMKKDFFKSAGGKMKLPSISSKTGAGRLTSIWQLIGAGGDTRNAKVLRKAGQKIFWRCDASEG